MSFEEYWKKQMRSEQLMILINRNAWLSAKKKSTASPRIHKSNIPAKDGVRLAELMNPIPESL